MHSSAEDSSRPGASALLKSALNEHEHSKNNAHAQKSRPVPGPFLGLKRACVPENSAHFSERTAEKSTKNEREQKLKNRAHGRSS